MPDKDVEANQEQDSQAEQHRERRPGMLGALRGGGGALLEKAILDFDHLPGECAQAAPARFVLRTHQRFNGAVRPARVDPFLHRGDPAIRQGAEIRNVALLERIIAGEIL